MGIDIYRYIDIYTTYACNHMYGIIYHMRHGSHTQLHTYTNTCAYTQGHQHMSIHVYIYTDMHMYIHMCNLYVYINMLDGGP